MWLLVVIVGVDCSVMLSFLVVFVRLLFWLNFFLICVDMLLIVVWCLCLVSWVMSLLCV